MKGVGEDRDVMEAASLGMLILDRVLMDFREVWPLKDGVLEVDAAVSDADADAVAAAAVAGG